MGSVILIATNFKLYMKILNTQTIILKNPA
nr:MAG TPA: hypothetical protein [Caudoviricetes sp.]